MTNTEYSLLAVAAIGLALWTRACAKRSVSSCALALLLGVVAAAAYFVAFRLTRINYLAVWFTAPFLIVLLLFRSWARTTAGKILTGMVIVLIAGSAVGEYTLAARGNSLLAIEPYRRGDIWCFDEPRAGLHAEPFVQGSSEIITRLAQNVPGCDTSVRLIFSQCPFPGYQQRLDLRRAQDEGGNWYYSQTYKMEGWLCPALFKFFPRAPRHIYVRAEPTRPRASR